MSLLRVLQARWYVFVAVLLVGGILVTRQASSVPPQYEAFASVLVVPPAGTQTSVTGGNPFLGLGQAQRYSSAALVSVMSSGAMRNRLVSAGLSPTYTATLTERELPLISVVASDEVEADALRTVDQLVIFTSEEFARLQLAAGATDVALSELVVLSTPETRSVRRLSLVRAVGLGVLFVALAATAMTVLVDLILRRTAARRGVRQRKRVHLRSRPESADGGVERVAAGRFPE